MQMKFAWNIFAYLNFLYILIQISIIQHSFKLHQVGFVLFNSCYDTEDIPAILAIPDTLFFQPAFPFSDYCLKRGKAQFVEYQPEES